MEDYPTNSKINREPPEKNIEQITSEAATTRKAPLRKQFSKTFFGGDARTAVQYMVMGVLLPAAKDALADAGAQGLEKLIFGEARTKRNPSAPSPLGRVQYNRPAVAQQQARTISHRARAQHDFDEVVLASRVDAERVIDRMMEIASQYGSVSVADLYKLVDIRSTHTDNNWGWTDLRTADVRRSRNGYLLDLPEPIPLD